MLSNMSYEQVFSEIVELTQSLDDTRIVSCSEQAKELTANNFTS